MKDTEQLVNFLSLRGMRARLIERKGKRIRGGITNKREKKRYLGEVTERERAVKSEERRGASCREGDRREKRNA